MKEAYAYDKMFVFNNSKLDESISDPPCAKHYLLNLARKEASKRVGGSRGSLLESGQSLLGNIDVGSSIGELVVHLDTDTVLVQHVRDTTGEEAKGCKRWERRRRTINGQFRHGRRITSPMV